jgi:hypothetical protein
MFIVFSEQLLFIDVVKQLISPSMIGVEKGI